MQPIKIIDTLRMIFSEMIQFVISGIGKKHARYMGYISIMTIIAIGVYFGQQQWIISREQRAQYALAHMIETFEQEVIKEDPNWNVFLTNIDEAYVQHSTSYLAPYFLNMKVEALLKQDNKKEALVVLSNIVSQLDHSVLSELLRTKKALLEIDLGDVTSGISKLETLIESKHNRVKDIAQFYLGRFYWVTNQDDKAKEIWKKLIEAQRVHRISPSPWVQEVQSLLETVS